jgi:hypothetical protein
MISQVLGSVLAEKIDERRVSIGPAWDSIQRELRLNCYVSKSCYQDAVLQSFSDVGGRYSAV